MTVQRRSRLEME